MKKKPYNVILAIFLAEREGFEPSRAVTPYPLSRRAH